MVAKMVVVRAAKALQRTPSATTKGRLTCGLYGIGHQQIGQSGIFGGTTEIMKEIIGRSLGV